jgi:HEAT repeat protein
VFFFQSACDGQPKKLLDGALERARGAFGDSRDRLPSKLQSARPKERAAAVKALAETDSPKDAVLVYRAAKDPSPVVRSEAAAALGRRRDDGSVEILAELLEDADEGVQASAAMAIAQLSGEKARQPLEARYARAGRATRRAIVRALGGAGVPRAMQAMVSAEAALLWERYSKALDDGRGAERAAAAEEIGRSGRPEAVARLAALANEAPPIVAAGAVRGLAQAGDPSAAAALVALLGENEPALRAAACDALGQLGALDAAPKLLAIAIEGSSASAFATAALIALPMQTETNRLLCEVAGRGARPQMKVAAQEMRSRGGCPSLTAALAAELRSPAKRRSGPDRRQVGDAREVESILDRLAALGGSAMGASSAVRELLDDRDAGVRRAALDAAAEIRDLEIGPDVRRAYEKQIATVNELRAKRTSDRSRRGGADAGTVPPDAPEPQLQLLASAARALGKSNAPEALELVKPCLADPSPLVRAGAYSGLPALGESGVDRATQGLADPEAEVRAVAAKALAEQGGKGAAAVVAHLDPLGQGSLELLEALKGAALGEAAAERLAPFLSRPGIESALAAQLLGQCGAKSAVTALLKCLDQPTAFGRRQALIALGELGDRRAAEAIARDLYHESPEIRAAAAQALVRVGGAAEIETLEALEVDYYASVRRTAKAAAEKLRSMSEVR